jgi:hypothetical protein
MAVSMASLHFSSCSLSPPRARRREHASRQHKHASSALACQPPPLLGMCPERRNRRRIDELGGGGGSSAACSSWRSEAESRASLGRSSFAPGLELGGGGSKAAPLLPRRLRAWARPAGWRRGGARWSDLRELAHMAPWRRRHLPPSWAWSLSSLPPPSSRFPVGQRAWARRRRGACRRWSVPRVGREWLDRAGGRDRREWEERREVKKEERDGLTCGACRRVAATLAKAPCKTAGWPKMNGFKSSMVKDFWFCRSMVKTKLWE